MKITIRKSELQKVFTAVSTVIAKKPIIPITSCVKLEFIEKEDKTLIKFMATDTATTMILGILIEKENVKDPAPVCIEHNMMLNLLKNLPEQPLDITFNIGNCSVKTETGVYDIVTFDSENFPIEPEVTDPIKFTMESSVLKDIVAAFKFTADDELRPVMNGVYFESEKSEVFVTSTNATYLFRKKINADIPECKCIFPKSSMNILKNIANEYTEVNIAISDKNIVINKGSMKAIFRKIEGIYPNVRVVIPNTGDAKTMITYQADHMNKTIDRLAISENVSNLCVLEKKGSTVVMSSTNKDINITASEMLETKAEDGEDVKIGMKMSLTQAILDYYGKAMVVQYIIDNSKAMLFVEEENDNILLLLMPMMIA